MTHPLHPIPDPFLPVDPFSETAELPAGTSNPLLDSHAELLDLAERLRAVLLVHGGAMIGDRVNELLGDLGGAIERGKKVR